MSGHTRGPWTLETVRTQSGICHKVGPFPWREGRDNHACIYVDYPNGAMGPVEAELKANASLIVAAPDLLAALTDLMPTTTCMERHGIRYDPAQVEAARAAIARATASLTQGDGHE